MIWKLCFKERREEKYIPSRNKMTSIFLQLNRQDASACSRAFDRVVAYVRAEKEKEKLQQEAASTGAAGQPQGGNEDRQPQQQTLSIDHLGNNTIPASELPRLFRYLGAVTANETLGTILRQFSRDSNGAPKLCVTRTDAMNIYGIWMRMISVNEPPALELLEQRVANTKRGESGSLFSNTTVLWLGVIRTVTVMAFTLVHWFSVFFRDADAALRCGAVGVGLDAGHTVLLILDLVVEYYKGDYAKDIRRAIDDIEECNIQKGKEEEQARRAAMPASSTTPAQMNSNNMNSTMMMSSPDMLAMSVGSCAGPLSGEASSVNAMDEDHQQHEHHQPHSPSQFAATTWDQFRTFLCIFCLRPKNLLALIALVPVDLFLCAGNATVAATVMNHFRLLSVFRNFIDIYPTPAPVPLTPLFADVYYSLMPLWTMTYSFIVACSIFAIIFIIFRNSSAPDTPLDFLVAFYLVVQTFTTVGYGDVQLIGTAETWFAVVLVLIGMITNAAVIGSLVALIQLGAANLVRGDKIRETHAVLHYFSIPRLLQLEILGFQEHVLFSDVESAFAAETEPLPPAMRDAMQLQHRLDVLRQVRPFDSDKASPEEMFLVAKELVCACFKPEEYLSCCSMPHHGVRILLFGLVDRLDARGRYIKTLRSGDAIGMDSILSGKDEEYNHKALSYCDLLVISYDDFHLLLDSLPRLRLWIVPELRKLEQEAADEDAPRLASEIQIVAAASSSNSGDNNRSSKAADLQRTGSSADMNNAAAAGTPLHKVQRAPVSMIDTTGGNLSMVHDLRNELRVLRRGLQTLAVAPALNK